MEMQLLPILVMSLLGGMLGVLMMIPLRQGLIVKEHGKLAYPEGTACADVLIVGERGGTTAKTVFLGFGLGAVYKFLMAGTKLWAEIPTRMLTFFKGASVSAEISPELLGVGYIIGPKVAANMFAGGILSYLILIPAIKIFGESLTAPMFPATDLIRDMRPDQVRNAYVLYIGAGAVATGGIISLIKSFPTIISAFRRGFSNFLESRKGKVSQEKVLRTEHDLPLSVVVFGSIGLVAAIWLSPILHINVISAILIVLFGFFFVTVSSRITGEIGSSSNPISGMTVATLLITCLLFLAVGWTGVSHRAMALCTAAIVCIAASNGGTISQDLKTGYLVGGTPRLQQIAMIIGVITSALVIGWIVIALNNAYTTIVPATHSGYVATMPADAPTQVAPDGQTYRVHYVSETTGDVLTGKYLVDQSNQIRYMVDPGIAGTVSQVDGKPVTKFDAPKARLFSMIIDGILTQKLPWGLVLIGVFLALLMELVGVSSLPFAVGLYLPISASMPIMAGGVIRSLVDRKRKTTATEAEFSPGVLMSSGFIAGGAIMGVCLAGLAGAELDSGINLSSYIGSLAEADWWALIPFAILMYALYRIGTKEK
jgi:uncharacterized oligopeptide transporter (OPT) family protein